MPQNGVAGSIPGSGIAPLGVPRSPGGGLTTVARNRAMDVLRRASREAVWFHEAATLLPRGDDPGGPGSDGFDGHEADFADDHLRLIFTCWPAVALAQVEELAAAGALSGYYLLHATRGDLLMRLQRPAEAADCFRTALRLAESGAATDAERRFLARRLAESGESA
jgi:predicted RNA polymerase sigma factor